MRNEECSRKQDKAIDLLNRLPRKETNTKKGMKRQNSSYNCIPGMPKDDVMYNTTMKETYNIRQGTKAQISPQNFGKFRIRKLF
jgi:hypothetical protein